MSKRTDITILLDRSGSMGGVHEQTITSFNAFIEAQRNEPGDCRVSLIQFDDKYEPNYSGRELGGDVLLDTSKYQPRGSTALLDSLVKAIDDTGKRLDASTEKPEVVIFVVLTDGLENASKEHTPASVKAKIDHQQGRYSWRFTFLGANQDACLTAQGLGIAAAAALTYGSTKKGTEAVFASLSNAVRSVRATGGAMSYSPQDRNSQDLAGSRR